MSMINPNYCHTITLYNCLKARDNPDKKEVWKRTVLEKCFYQSSNTLVQNGTEATMANTYTVRIPQDARYLPYRNWAGQEEYFTVSEGDIVVCGECQDEITGESGKTASEILRKNKPNAFKVTSFSDNTSHRMGKHYRLGG